MHGGQVDPMHNNLSDDSQEHPGQTMMMFNGQEGMPPNVIQGLGGHQFQQYPLKHPANMHPQYRGIN